MARQSEGVAFENPNFMVASARSIVQGPSIAFHHFLEGFSFNRFHR